MTRCFLCSRTTDHLRSLTQVNANPSGPLDAVPICHSCQADWNFSLMEILRSDLAHLNHQPIALTTFDRNANKPQG